MFNDFFATKYRVMTAYQGDKQVGFIVFEQKFLCPWEPSLVSEIKKTNDGIELDDRVAFFPTEDEAMDYIHRKKAWL